MDILFVNSCMREQSRTYRLCRSYIQKHYNNDCVKEIALHRESFAPLSRKDLAERDKLIAAADLCSAVFSAAREFASADEILIGAPYWDYLVPAALKCYLERVSVTGITFGYVDNAPKGLCRAKKLVYITTAGGYIAEDAALVKYLGELCLLYSIGELKFIKAEGLDIQGNDPESILFEAQKRL